MSCLHDTSGLRPDARLIPAPSFELHVLPILTARGCNQGACHGKARGQNGFQLSLLGFDPESDYAAIALEARGRRVFPAAPVQSLLLQKASAQVPQRLEVVTVMSDTKIDLTQAVMPAGIVEIDMRVVWAACKVVVPPGMRVINEMHAIMASVHSKADDAAASAGS